MKERLPFQQMLLEHLALSRPRRKEKKQMNLDLNLTPNIKINLKWIMDLNIKLKTITLLEK